MVQSPFFELIYGILYSYLFQQKIVCINALRILLTLIGIVSLGDQSLIYNLFLFLRKRKKFIFRLMIFLFIHTD